MKKIFLLLFLLTFSLNVYAQSTSNKTTLVQKPLVTTIKSSTLQEAKVVISELDKELKSAKINNQNLQKNLENTKLELSKAEVQVSDLQKNLTLLRDWGIEQQNKAFEWMEKHNKAIKRYHFLKNVTGIIAAIYGFTFGVYLMKYVPPVYSAYAFALPIVTSILAFFLVWLIL
jgi:septal ring factor EnvC (AmiA/AmiB activator)